MKNNLETLPHQIDLKASDKIPNEVINWIKDNSTRVQHLLDEDPRITRWWFKEFNSALSAILKIQERKESIDYRLLCLETDSLYLQHGDF